MRRLLGDCMRRGSRRKSSGRWMWRQQARQGGHIGPAVPAVQERWVQQSGRVQECRRRRGWCGHRLIQFTALLLRRVIGRRLKTDGERRRSDGERADGERRRLDGPTGSDTWRAHGQGADGQTGRRRRRDWSWTNAVRGRTVRQSGTKREQFSTDRSTRIEQRSRAQVTCYTAHTGRVRSIQDNGNSWTRHWTSQEACNDPGLHTTNGSTDCDSAVIVTVQHCRH